ncbi:hypothetical protein GJAV_G00193740 [Gymnothorax javanicus]|nr:hypothetical protein GJAV_G00193740 [Gymnothorax javanicus]
MGALLAFIKKLLSVRKQLVVVLSPLLFLPVIFALPDKEGKCMYVLLLMAMYWCTEALPLAVTALLPICLFPTMGVLPSKKVCPQYFLDTNFLFFSGLVMASAIEEWNLHRRIALKVLMVVGLKPVWLILGMMITTSFLSMWLSNTATTAMMLPIANAILESLFGDLKTLREKCKIKDETNGKTPVKLHTMTSEKQMLTIEDGRDVQEPFDGRTALEIRKEAEYQLKVWKGFLICIPYAASIGGTATLTGTTPNLIMVGQMKSNFPDCDLINFGSWFVFAFPLMVLFLLLAWIWIAFLFGGLKSQLKTCTKKQNERTALEAKARAVIADDYEKLGPMSFAERSIAFFFIIFAVLLFTRDPKFFPGWAKLFIKGYVSDPVTGVIIVSLLFFFPAHKPNFNWWLDFKAPNTERGFAMAKGCEESGLASWIGKHLQPLAEVPPGLALILITAFVACFTEFASNTATIIIFLPIIAELALNIQINPLYFMIPATVGCSFAFMLPVSTPPNSIAFASGHLMVKDMVKTGAMMNAVGILVVCLAVNTWGMHMFNLSTFPDWAVRLNTSSAVVHPHNLTVLHLNSTV